MSDGLAERVAACEVENLRLRKLVRRQNRIWATALLAAVIGTATASVAVKTSVFDSIQAKDITIVDQNGTVRARMSGDMPDAIAHGGRVVKRGAKAAGFMIYDRDGIERGGYVTFDDQDENAMLSLDSKYHMLVSLIAAPEEEGTSVLDIMSARHGMSLRSSGEGSRISISKDRKVEQQIPVIEKVGAEQCSEYRQWAKTSPNENWCRTRYTEAACNRCLEPK